MLQSILFTSLICIGLPASTRAEADFGDLFTCDELSALISQKCGGKIPGHDVDIWCHNLTPAEKQDTINQFDVFDLNRDGVTTYSEFSSSYRGTDLDTDWIAVGGGHAQSISISQFLIAVLIPLANAAQKELKRFATCGEHKKMYSDVCGCPQTSIGSWCISVADLKIEPAWTQLFHEFDTDGNGQLSIEEFGVGWLSVNDKLTTEEIIDRWNSFSVVDEISIVEWMLWSIKVGGS